MFKVTTIETWNNVTTDNVYKFRNISERNKFINLCLDGGISIIIHKI